MGDVETSPFITRPSHEPLASGVPPPAMRRQGSIHLSGSGVSYGGAGGELSAALNEWHRDSLDGMHPEQLPNGEEAPGGPWQQIFNSIIYGCKSALAVFLSTGQ